MGESVTVGLGFGGFVDRAWDRLGYVSAMLIRQILRVVSAELARINFWRMFVEKRKALEANVEMCPQMGFSKNFF